MAGDSESDEDLILRDPVAPVWASEGPGGDFKVPTVALAAEVFCDDGRQFKGRIFLPASARSCSYTSGSRSAAARESPEPASFSSRVTVAASMLWSSIVGIGVLPGPIR